MATKRYSKRVSVDNDMGDLMDVFKEQLNRPMGHEVGRHILRFTQAAIANNFARQVDSSNRRWPELSDWTQRERPKEGYPPDNPKLIRTRELFDQATQELRIDTSRTALTISPEFFSTKGRIKWMVHNRPVSDVMRISIRKGTGGDADLGDVTGERVVKIPGREFFYLTKDHVGIIADTILLSVLVGVSRTAKTKVEDSAIRSMTVELMKKNRSTIRTANRHSGAQSWFRFSRTGSVG